MKAHDCYAGRIQRAKFNQKKFPSYIKTYDASGTQQDKAKAKAMRDMLKVYPQLIKKWSNRALQCRKKFNVTGLCIKADCYKYDTIGHAIPGHGPL